MTKFYIYLTYQYFAMININLKNINLNKKILYVFAKYHKFSKNDSINFVVEILKKKS